MWSVLVETGNHFTPIGHNYFNCDIQNMAVEVIPNKELDKWIENLSNCKQLQEVEVKRLTDKVS